MRNLLLLSITTVMAALLPAGISQAASTNMGEKFKQLEQRLMQQEKEIAQLKLQRSDGKLSAAHRTQIRKIIKDMNLSASAHNLPKWMENLTFYGDLRLRAQTTWWKGDTDGQGRRKDRNRARFRLRVGMKKTWLDKQMEVGFRLASGSNASPQSTWQTFSSTGGFPFSKKPIWIDLAYATYRPKAVKGLKLTGGKMSNPFVHTLMTWDGDVNPEGFYGQYTAPFWGDFKPFIGVGYFVLNEVAQATADSTLDHDSDMFAYTTGFDWKVKKNLKWTMAGTFYDWQHYSELGNAASLGLAANPVEAGRGFSAGGFRTINLTTKLKFNVKKLPTTLIFDWVHNLGDSDRTAKIRNHDDGFMVGVKFGKNKKKGDWSAGYTYAWIGANATPGDLNDANLGTNISAHIIAAKYNITDWLTGQVTTIFGAPITDLNATNRDGFGLARAELLWKF